MRGKGPSILPRLANSPSPKEDVVGALLAAKTELD